MARRLLKKGFSIGTVALLILIGFSSVITAQINTITSKAHSIPQTKNINEVKLIVSEYRADGSVGLTPIMISRNDFDNLKSEIQGVTNLDEQLSVFKKHGLIPANVTSEQLRQGMMEKTRKLIFSDPLGNMFISKNRVIKNPLPNSIFQYLIRDYDTSVYGSFIANFKLHFGLSFFTAPVNTLLEVLGRPFLLPSADFLDYFIFLWGDIATEKYSIIGNPGIVTIIGFVGYMIDLSPLLIIPFPFISWGSEFAGYAKLIRVSYEDAQGPKL